MKIYLKFENTRLLGSEDDQSSDDKSSTKDLNVIINDDLNGKSPEYYQKKYSDISSKLKKTIKMNKTLSQLLDKSH